MAASGLRISGPAYPDDERFDELPALFYGSNVYGIRI
jgi:hypothetical protein